MIRLWICFSRSYSKDEIKILVGNLKGQTHLKLLELGLSLIFFHILGTWHLEIDMLKSLVTEKVDAHCSGLQHSHRYSIRATGFVSVQR